MFSSDKLATHVRDLWSKVNNKSLPICLFGSSTIREVPGQPGSKTAIFIPSFIYFYIYIVVEVLFYIILVAKTGVMIQLINNRSQSCFSYVREILTYKIQYNERQEI